MSRLVLALDFGGTKLAAGLVDLESEQLIAREVQPTPPGDARAVLAAMVALARGLLARGAAPVAAVGVSFGGPVDVARGRVLRSHHVPGWEDFPLVETLAHAFGRPVALDNDGNAMALGEWRFGAARGAAALLYVNIGTGIGGGLVLGGRVYRGRGLAGEIGHMVLWPEGPVCPCGKRGCLEALAAGPAIARRASERAGRVFPEAAAVFAAAVSEPAVQMALQECLDFLARGLANAAVLLDPSLIVLGGGVAQAGPALFEPVQQALPRYIAPLPTPPPVVPSRLGADLGLWGAAALAESLLETGAV